MDAKSIHKVSLECWCNTRIHPILGIVLFKINMSGLENIAGVVEEHWNEKAWLADRFLQI